LKTPMPDIDGIFTSSSASERSVSRDEMLAAIRRSPTIENTQNLCVLLNKYSGPKNGILYELMKTAQDETAEAIESALAAYPKKLKTKDERVRAKAEIAFEREYRNGTIVRLCENHAEMPFNFFALKDVIRNATGKETRANHVIHALSGASERWADERMDAFDRRHGSLEANLV